MCIMCMGEEHARPDLEEAGGVYCESLSMSKLRSCLDLFLREESVLGLAAARAA